MADYCIEIISGYTEFLEIYNKLIKVMIIDQQLIHDN